VDALREKVGDAHVQLALAGELYMPLGTALKNYGTEVRDTIKTTVNTRYSDAHEKWQTYAGLPGDKDGRAYFPGIGKPAEGSPEAADQAEEDAAKEHACEIWIDAVERDDAAHDTRETACATAVTTSDAAFSDDRQDPGCEKVKQGFNWVAGELS